MDLSSQKAAHTAGDNSQLLTPATFQNFDPAVPFFQEDYPSQRFRPEKVEEQKQRQAVEVGESEDPDDPYYSPPPTFIPPESPNEISVKTFGYNRMTQNYSFDSDALPQSNVPLSSIIEKIPPALKHQTHTFNQLAVRDGVREWNNETIDDRWRLKPEEIIRNRPDRWTNLIAEEPGNIERIDLSERIALSKKVMADRFGRMQDPEQFKIMQQEQEERFRELNRLLTPPPEIARLEHFVSEMEHSSEPLPPGICTEPAVLRNWFRERVFVNGERAGPIHGERGDRYTTYRGFVAKLKDIRQMVLKDIDDLVAFAHSPAGEGIRAKMEARIIDDRGASPAGGVEVPNTRVKDPSPSQSFREQLGTIESHTSRGDQTQSQDPVTVNLPVDQRPGVKPTKSPKPATTSSATTFQTAALDRLIYDTRQFNFKETTALPKTHTGWARFGAVNNPVSQHHFTAPTTTAPPIKNPPITAPPTSAPVQHKMDEQYPGGSVGGQAATAYASDVPFDDANVGQPGNQRYLFGVAPQQVQYGVYPGSMCATSQFSGQLPQMPQIQQPWVYQHPSNPFHQPNYTTSQPMPYGCPWQPAYPQPAPAYLGYQPSTVGRQPYNPPPMPLGREVRPPAPNRAARMSALQAVFQNPANMQGPGTSSATATPPPFTHNTEWLNRYGPQPKVVPNVPVLPYRIGSETMYPCPGVIGSPRFQRLMRDPLNIDFVTHEDNLPFMENAKMSKPAEWGVLKIGNIPYDLTKASILNFLGPHAKIITTDFGPPVHIIMDRSTGKTMDCFVEFFSTHDARACINSILLRSVAQNKIGDRVVEPILSSQEELMTELFPKAKNVKWLGAKPEVQEPTELFNSGFKGFVSLEELGCLVRHAEQPHRSNYTQRSPQRTYESLISLLAKFPWSDVSHYTLSTRTHIFQATRQMLHILSINVRKIYNAPANPFEPPIASYGPSAGYGGDWPSHSGMAPLTEALLQELLMAAMNAPGFSEKQRWELFDMSDYARSHFRVSPILQYWPFEVLGRKPNVEEDVVQLYANMIANHPFSNCPENTPFGNFKHITDGFDMESHTMEKVGEMERQMLYLLIEGGIKDGKDVSDQE